MQPFSVQLTILFTVKEFVIQVEANLKAVLAGLLIGAIIAAVATIAMLAWRKTPNQLLA